MASKVTPRVVIVGAGFGGLNAARTLAKAPVQITVIDRRNYHTFQPLLYQVATAGLSPGEIAAPIRSILRSHRNIEVLMSEVTDFDLEHRIVKTPDAEIPYDYLIVAAGASHAYFGHDDWEPFAPGLKTIEDALEIRRRVLLAFELAERQAASGETTTPLNFVVVGGGPTGVELAGTLAEISHHALAHEFRSIDPSRTHILLIEGGPRVLAAYAEDSSRSAQEQLNRLGVEVRTSTVVTQIEPGAVYAGSTRLPATVVLWAAGVAASPLGKCLGVPIDRAGRVLVQPDLSIPGRPEVFVIGDLASLKNEHGKMLPGVAPTAIQQGRFVCQSDSPGSGVNAGWKSGGWLTPLVPLLGQRQPGHHWPGRGRGGVRTYPHLRLRGVVILALRSHLLSHRLPQSLAGLYSMGMVLCHLRAWCAVDHWEHLPAWLDS